MSFGFITFCGKLPWGAFGYFFNTFFSKITDLTLIFTWNRLKLEVNPIMKDVLFFEDMQAVYSYFKDLPPRVVNCFFSLLATADGWTTFTFFFSASMDTA